MIHETAVTTDSSIFFNASLVFVIHASCTVGRCCEREVCQLLWVLLPVAVYWLILADMQVCRYEEYELLLAINGTSQM